MVREQGGETRGLEKGEGSFLAPVALGARERIGVFVIMDAVFVIMN